ncbi:MAG TPA: hypothetical protein ENN18_07545 [Proteobacteria bacterium]|nr:hypothetical protein [Pseudomonadota bacterium]
MKFCDMQCKYASWPKDEAVDGAASCRTFQAIYCEKKGRLVHKNLPCPEKIQRSRPDESVNRPFHR